MLFFARESLACAHGRECACVLTSTLGQAVRIRASDISARSVHSERMSADVVEVTEVQKRKRHHKEQYAKRGVGMARAGTPKAH